MLHKYNSKDLVVSCISSEVSVNISNSKVAVYLKRRKQVGKTPLFSAKSNLWLVEDWPPVAAAPASKKTGVT
jgi:hypothetical protein